MPLVRLSAAMAPPAAAPPTTAGTQAINCVDKIAAAISLAIVFNLSRFIFGAFIQSSFVSNCANFAK